MKSDIVRKTIDRNNCYFRTDFYGARTVFNDEENGLCIMLCVEVYDRETSRLIGLKLPYNTSYGTIYSRCLKISPMVELDLLEWSFSDVDSFVSFVYEGIYDSFELEGSFPDMYAVIWDAIEKEREEYYVDTLEKAIVRNIDG